MKFSLVFYTIIVIASLYYIFFIKISGGWLPVSFIFPAIMFPYFVFKNRVDVNPNILLWLYLAMIVTTFFFMFTILLDFYDVDSRILMIFASYGAITGGFTFFLGIVSYIFLFVCMGYEEPIIRKSMISLAIITIIYLIFEPMFIIQICGVLFTIISYFILYKTHFNKNVTL